MKRGRLPLTALRSFEAAGRHLSFSRAAEELFVSQAAISRQVRELEDTLDQPLFQRLHRRVELTDAGQALLEQLTASFDDIDRRLTQISERPRSVLHVSVEPSFAGEFLVQRLNAFQEHCPDIDVAINSEPRVVDFRNHEVELAIRYGMVARSWPRTEALHLLDLMLTPVMTQEVRKTLPATLSPADLRDRTLIHDQTRDAWVRWFAAAGITDPPQRGPLYADSALALQAAKLGHGIALGDRMLDGDDLAGGRLVRPFDLEVPYGAYWLVAPNLQRLGPAAKAFADWLVGQMQPGSAPVS